MKLWNFTSKFTPPIVTVHYSRSTMTQAQQAAFDEASAHMDRAMKAIDRAFRDDK